MMKAVLDKLEAGLRGSESILDAGVGTGRFAGPLRERGLDVVGIDVSKAMLAEAKKKNTPDLVRGELTAMPFVDGAFDSCLMVHVLHLVESPAKLLAEIARVCSGNVFSLAETSDYVSVRENYIRLLSAKGYRWGDLSEQKLTLRLPPDEEKEVISYQVERAADDDIDYFNRRMSAVTWDVPDTEHLQIIEGLRRKLGGRTFRFTTTVRLVGWKSEHLANPGLA